jgi:YfiH family protein
LAGHVGDEPAAVAENRRRLAAALGLPSEPVWLEQVHGSRVLDLDLVSGLGAALESADGAALEPADGAVTSRAGMVCAILTADCVPVLLADRRGGRIGAAHAGWRGLVSGVLPAAVAALGCPPAEVVAWLGPAISQPAFEVGDEVRAAFEAAEFDCAAAFVRNARGRWQASLHGLAAQSLRAAGVSAVFRSEACTYREPDRFFSHRREAPCGRFATLIWIG